MPPLAIQLWYADIVPVQGPQELPEHEAGDMEDAARTIPSNHPVVSPRAEAPRIQRPALERNPLLELLKFLCSFPVGCVRWPLAPWWGPPENMSES